MGFDSCRTHITNELVAFITQTKLEIGNRNFLFGSKQPKPSAPLCLATLLLIQFRMAEGSNMGPPSHETQQEPWRDVSLGHLRQNLADFARERDWEQFHSPRNLLLALVGEVGELSELFQWKGEVQRGLPTFTPAEKEHCAEELSDVLLYLCRLADTCGIDLGAAALSKIQKNALKYPAEKCRGSSAKACTYAEGGQS
ncbi:hypothetical protein DUNSADRAFT_12994 [Dunaliella salina]|uniref:Uncharacterized protein n=1 Tax=Dunaliella salina TaxID=3046 RepID=A0ABQ7GA97_DUNSA|nr:hypothetical protein DUNSADRAFT_12994 [Dunaliella salina]|eukprot:KAF5831521.1 hypothetical protein DUNSADRAFT_12994 [Dunaliella salina]